MGILDRRVVLLRIPDQRSVPQVLAAVANDPRIEASQPNFLYTFQSDGKAQTVPDLQYALAKVGLAPTQRLATGRDTLIAVLDTGVDRAHPDLVNATIDEVDLTGETEGRNRLPEDAHGTAIAGIIGARGVLRGAAPDARLLSLKAFRQSRDGATSTATTYILLTGLDTAAERGAHVINMSFAGPADPALREAVKQCTGRRIVTVAAAGNKGPDAPAAYPAAYPEVIAVTATDSVDRLYGRANRGGYIAVAAPGVDVLTPALAWSHQMQTGTSFAAAHVSAIVALLIERDPSLTPESIRVILVETAKDLGEPGPDREFGAGRADAFAALQRVTAKAGGPGRAKIAAPSPAGTANR
jgi:subtilisin family serine protease